MEQLLSLEEITEVLGIAEKTQAENELMKREAEQDSELINSLMKELDETKSELMKYKMLLNKLERENERQHIELNQLNEENKRLLDMTALYQKQIDELTNSIMEWNKLQGN